MTTSETSYGMVKALPDLKQADAVAAIKAALKEEGFGVLSEIDVCSTLKEKLDLDFRPYVILGACNPHLASRALEGDGQVGLLMPCNVVVQAAEKGSVVSILDPAAIQHLSDAPVVAEVMAEAREHLQRALATL